MANCLVVIHRYKVGVTTRTQRCVSEHQSKLEPTVGEANGGEVIRMADR